MTEPAPRESESPAPHAGDDGAVSDASGHTSQEADPVPLPADNTTQTRALTAVVVLVVIALCVAVGALVNAQAGTLLLAGAAFAGVALRMWLPAGRAFSVRRRAVDISLMLAFGVALAFLGLTTPLG
ncbi:DUF3017 domain-containing protein [Demequina globuliformis]|uniref:DUF3017 domain-containing protein n=1 Tax=Demequina globuliformis TaxID=676202 RepID=UPI0007833D44|nr:DUF3017 domain-containing protein [Demequina globuliformis]